MYMYLESFDVVGYFINISGSTSPSAHVYMCASLCVGDAFQVVYEELSIIIFIIVVSV